MLKSFLLLIPAFALGCAAPAGPRGPTGAPGPDTVAVALVEPHFAFLGREEEVVISLASGDAQGSAVLDFGAGIEVTELEVVGPAVLRAHVSVALDAPVGVRDVRIVQGTNAASALGAFEVRPTLEIEGPSSVPQGGLARLRLHNADPANLLQLDTHASRLEIESSGIAHIHRSSQTASAFDGYFVASPEVEPVRVRLTGHDGLHRFKTVFVTAANALEVVPRTPVALGPEPLAGALADGLATGYFVVAAPGSGIVTVVVETAEGESWTPGVVTFVGGRAHEGSSIALSEAGNVHVVVYDHELLDVPAPRNYTIRAVFEPAAPIAWVDLPSVRPTTNLVALEAGEVALVRGTLDGAAHNGIQLAVPVGARVQFVVALSNTTGLNAEGGTFYESWASLDRYTAGSLGTFGGSSELSDPVETGSYLVTLGAKGRSDESLLNFADESQETTYLLGVRVERSLANEETE
jgi:hypothetical protein